MLFNPSEISIAAICFADIQEVEYNYIVQHHTKIDDWHHSSEVVTCFDSKEKAIDYVSEANFYDRNVKGFDWFDFVVEVN